MNESRLADYLDHMQQAALDARAFVDLVWDTVQKALPELLALWPTDKADPS